MAATLSACVLATGGVASATDVPDNWDGLVQIKPKRMDMVYVLPGADFRPYSKVLLDGTEVRMQEQGPDGVSRSVVMDFRGEIVVIKDLIFRLYKQGFTSKDAEETASCLRAISWASLALCRLVQTQDEFTPLKPVNPLAVMRSKAILSRVEGTIERLEGGIDRLYKPTLSKR